ncbi:S1C family serine protease [Gulosibacter sediminis]|uniref:S1C family serine protease n=1 Tax=Gulosibacter sediminis TaxID=1729695 RepID=UPI0024AE336F|nr:trypsin-like peptidase domain-containing protein [Gulosibacter sediminis]
MNDSVPTSPKPRVWRGLTAVAAGCGLVLAGALGGLAVSTGNTAQSAWRGAEASTEQAQNLSPASQALKQQLLDLVPWVDEGTSSGGLGQGTDGQSGGSLGGSTQQSTDSLDISAASADESTGIVLIDTKLEYQSAAAAGTGIVLSSDGLVLTNNHVVEGSTSVQVTTTDGTTYNATVVGTDSTQDVAVLQLENASGLTTATIDDDDDLAVSDAVTAVGNAEGGGDLMAADGVVTDLNASVTPSNEAASGGTTGSNTLTNMIEIDADVVSGDSGGAVLDDEGEVVGMTTAASSGGTNISGYAIEIDTALSVAQDIIDGVETDTNTLGTPAFLGIALADTTSDTSSSSVAGAAVAGVYDDTPAAEVGLAAGDTITAVDGIAVGSASELQGLIAEYTPGTEVTLTWTTSSGAEQSGTTTLVEGPAN